MLKKALVTFLLLNAITYANACTDIQINAKDGSVVVGRTMEYAENMNFSVVVMPGNQAASKHIPGWETRNEMDQQICNCGHCAL